VAHDPPKPQLELMFRASVAVAAPRSLGRTPAGERRIVDIVGGEVTGSRLSGRILPGGADWQIVRDDGTAVLEARYTIEAADGALIYVRNPDTGTARRTCSSASRAARTSGDLLCMAPVFET
jgi:hypothetical protein